jgi:hypothetical protein
MARRLTAAQAKQAKQKKLVILLGVIFVVVAAVQGPRFLKQLHPKPAGMAAPAPGSVPAAAGAATGAAAAPAATGQLHTFSHLKLKDPFKALVTIPVAVADSSTPSADAAKSEAPPAKTTPETTPETTPKAPKAPKAASEPTASGTVSFSATAPPPNAAIVTTNGKKQLVYIGDGFPTADPVFRLVALAHKAVRVGVLGGSFTDGVPTIKLARGKPVTLANQADGSRYVIKLVRLTTAAPKPVLPGKGASAAPATPAPAATTPVTTTPATTTATTTTTTTTTGS